MNHFLNYKTSELDPGVTCSRPSKLCLVPRGGCMAGLGCRTDCFSLSLSAVASRGSSSARQRVRLKPLRPLTKRKQQAALQAAGNADICQAHTSAFTFAAHSQLKHETSTTTPASRTSSKLVAHACLHELPVAGSASTNRRT